MFRKIRGIIFWVLLISLAFIFVFNGFQLIQKVSDYSNAEKEYSELKKFSPIIPTGSATPSATLDLKNINSDYVGWIRAEGTNIDYPMVKSNDDTYYLQHTFKRQKNSVGAIFLDYRNKSDFSDKNTVIFGHHMRNDTMFAQLNLYKNSYFANLHPFVIIDTPVKHLKYEYFASYIMPSNKNILMFNFPDEKAFSNYISVSKAQSAYKSKMKFTKDDKILTLITCTYEYDNARYVVHFKLVST